MEIGTQSRLPKFEDKKAGIKPRVLGLKTRASTQKKLLGANKNSGKTDLKKAASLKQKTGVTKSATAKVSKKAAASASSTRRVTPRKVLTKGVSKSIGSARKKIAAIAAKSSLKVAAKTSISKTKKVAATAAKRSVSETKKRKLSSSSARKIAPQKKATSAQRRATKKTVTSKHTEGFDNILNMMYSPDFLQKWTPSAQGKSTNDFFGQLQTFLAQPQQKSFGDWSSLYRSFSSPKNGQEKQTPENLKKYLNEYQKLNTKSTQLLHDDLTEIMGDMGERYREWLQDAMQDVSDFVERRAKVSSPDAQLRESLEFMVTKHTNLSNLLNIWSSELMQLCSRIVSRVNDSGANLSERFYNVITEQPRH